MARRTLLGRAVRTIGESWLSIIGATIVLFWVVIALGADILAPFPPNATLTPLQRPMSPAILAPATMLGQTPAAAICPAVEGGLDCGTFWLGTDVIGRDILSRIMHGARTVLFYAPLATLLAYAFGASMGLLAGYRGGWVDDALSFVSNVILSFPVLVLYVVIISVIGSSGANILIAVIFASAPAIMRIVRGLTMDIRNREYVMAAETRGEPVWRILFVEILPNARGPLIVDFCVRIGYVTITIGVLGFLGLGLPPPNPDWGGMVNETRQMAMVFPHMALFPCLAITSLVLGFNLLADGLNESALRD
ncbi:MAG: ABC transporter permease [Rhodobacteraceae bacterium]|nr:MAG: ABC transporter permease [Paracoccaceae bacterium]